MSLPYDARSHWRANRDYDDELHRSGWDGSGGAGPRRLRRARLGTNIAVTIGTCDSNTSSITGPTNIACFMPPYKTQINESYWWEILIDCSDPRVNVEFLMVGMRYYATEAASARNTTMSAHPSGVLTPDSATQLG